MTDRVHTLTVSLEKDIRTDDVEVIMGAIRALRGVLAVTGEVADPAFHTAQMRAGFAYRTKLLEAMNEIMDEGLRGNG